MTATKKSFRLTAHHRGWLASTLAERSVGEARAKAKKDLLVLADKAYDTVYGKYAAAIDALPDKALPMCSDILVSLAGQKHRVAMSSEKRMFAYHMGWHSMPALTLVATDPMCVKMEALIKEIHDLTTKHHDSRRTIEQALQRFGSYKAMIEAWPDVEPVAAELFKDDLEAVILPAVVTSELNKIAGLPVTADEKKAKKKNT